MSAASDIDHQLEQGFSCIGSGRAAHIRESELPGLDAKQVIETDARMNQIAVRE